MKTTSKAAPATKKTLEIKYLATGSLTGDPKNSRTHDESQIGQVAASIEEFGFTNPILTDGKGGVIAGHGRLAAALKLGLEQVPTIALLGLSAAQKRAYMLADNKLALNAGWNLELLRGELSDLREAGFDLSLTGFQALELVDIFAEKTGKADEDSIPADLPAVCSKVGDVWVLGSHRVTCGDSTDPATIKRLLAGAKIDMLLTDPPYCSGGFQEAGKSAGSVGTRGTEMIANDTLSTRGYMALMKAALPGFGAGVVYVFTDWRMWINLFDVVESSGYGVRNMIVWDKQTPGMGAGWRMQHELVMCGVRVKSPFNPKKAQGNVIQGKRTGNILHATEKPVDLIKTIIEVTDMAKTVGDPFSGSGTTLIAAEMTGRAFYGVELSPRYVDVIVRRWMEFTGKTATLESTGKSFGDTAKARLKHAA